MLQISEIFHHFPMNIIFRCASHMLVFGAMAA